MKSSFHAHALTVLLLSGFSYADTPLIRTTVADSSRVGLIAQTPLSWETVELIFGTSDGCLHCWELGSSSAGYAPWTQFKHDPRRSGVLE